MKKRVYIEPAIGNRELSDDLLVVAGSQPVDISQGGDDDEDEDPNASRHSLWDDDEW